MSPTRPGFIDSFEVNILSRYYGGIRLRAIVDIYDTERGTVCIARNPEGDEGLSVTNGASDLWTDVRDRFKGRDHPSNLLFVEHYPSTVRGMIPPTYDQVTFRFTDPYLGTPIWKHLGQTLDEALANAAGPGKAPEPMPEPTMVALDVRSSGEKRVAFEARAVATLIAGAGNAQQAWRTDIETALEDFAGAVVALALDRSSTRPIG